MSVGRQINQEREVGRRLHSDPPVAPASAASKTLPGVSAERMRYLDALRVQVQNGTYTVDAESLARKLLRIVTPSD